MEKALREKHNVIVRNITLPENCIGDGNAWRYFIRNIVGYETIVLNQLM